MFFFCVFGVWVYCVIFGGGLVGSVEVGGCGFVWCLVVVVCGFLFFGNFMGCVVAVCGSWWLFLILLC